MSENNLEKRVEVLEGDVKSLLQRANLIRNQVDLVNLKADNQMVMSMTIWEFISSLGKSQSELLNRIADSTLVSEPTERLEILKRAGDLCAECDKIEKQIASFGRLIGGSDSPPPVPGQ